MAVWQIVWAVFCRFTPKPFYKWRLFVVRVFGADVSGAPFIHQRAKISHPWNLEIQDGVAIGDGASIYCQDRIVLEHHVTIAQECYLCTGTHDFSSQNLELVTLPIIVKSEAFLGLRVTVLPGVTIGSGCIIGACSVVTRDVPDRVIAVGNPARVSRCR